MDSEQKIKTIKDFRLKIMHISLILFKALIEIGHAVLVWKLNRIMVLERQPIYLKVADLN